jgi:hypothetical protein
MRTFLGFITLKKWGSQRQSTSDTDRDEGQRDRETKRQGGEREKYKKKEREMERETLTGPADFQDVQREDSLPRACIPFARSQPPR